MNEYSCERELDLAERELFKQEATIAAQAAAIARWKRAVEGLTPSGSEFVDDPERCAQFIRDFKMSIPPRIVRLEARIDALTQALEVSDAALSAAVVYMKVNMRKPYFSVEVDLLHSLKDARKRNAALLAAAPAAVPVGGAGTRAEVDG